MIWSLHKKKNSASALAREPIPTFFHANKRALAGSPRTPPRPRQMAGDACRSASAAITLAEFLFLSINQITPPVRVIAGELILTFYKAKKARLRGSLRTGRRPASDRAA